MILRSQQTGKTIEVPDGTTKEQFRRVVKKYHPDELANSSWDEISEADLSAPSEQPQESKASKFASAAKSTAQFTAPIAAGVGAAHLAGNVSKTMRVARLLPAMVEGGEMAGAMIGAAASPAVLPGLGAFAAIEGAGAVASGVAKVGINAVTKDDYSLNEAGDDFSKEVMYNLAGSALIGSAIKSSQALYGVTKSALKSKAAPKFAADAASKVATRAEEVAARDAKNAEDLVYRTSKRAHEFAAQQADQAAIGLEHVQRSAEEAVDNATKAYNYTTKNAVKQMSERAANTSSEAHKLATTLENAQLDIMRKVSESYAAVGSTVKKHISGLYKVFDKDTDLGKTVIAEDMSSWADEVTDLLTQADQMNSSQLFGQILGKVKRFGKIARSEAADSSQGLFNPVTGSRETIPGVQASPMTVADAVVLYKHLNDVGMSIVNGTTTAAKDIGVDILKLRTKMGLVLNDATGGATKEANRAYVHFSRAGSKGIINEYEAGLVAGGKELAQDASQSTLQSTQSKLFGMGKEIVSATKDRPGSLGAALGREFEAGLKSGADLLPLLSVTTGKIIQRTQLLRLMRSASMDAVADSMDEAMIKAAQSSTMPNRIRQLGTDLAKIAPDLKLDFTDEAVRKMSKELEGLRNSIPEHFAKLKEGLGNTDALSNGATESGARLDTVTVETASTVAAAKKAAAAKTASAQGLAKSSVSMVKENVSSKVYASKEAAKKATKEAADLQDSVKPRSIDVVALGSISATGPIISSLLGGGIGAAVAVPLAALVAYARLSKYSPTLAAAGYKAIENLPKYFNSTPMTSTGRQVFQRLGAELLNSMRNPTQ